MRMMHAHAHPGKVLRSYLEGRSVTEVAKHLNITRVMLSRILNEQAGISADVSMRLGEALGTSLDFWFKMQNGYDFWSAAQKKRNPVEPFGKVA